MSVRTHEKKYLHISRDTVISLVMGLGFLSSFTVSCFLLPSEYLRDGRFLVFWLFVMLPIVLAVVLAERIER